MENNAALKHLASAVLELLDDENLAYADPGERHVVSELFAKLRLLFPGYTVSNEYDRREQETKRLGDSKIVPDLVVHRVGQQADNLLVVEVKLARNKNYKSDIRKLSGMTDAGGSYCYALGVHLALDVPRRKIARSDVYINGELSLEMTTSFQSILTEMRDKPLI
jgi:hypothetical protein